MKKRKRVRTRIHSQRSESSKSFFTSNREIRLWIYTLVVVVGIYSTLGLANAIAGELKENGLLDTFFIFSILLVGAAIMAQTLRKQSGGTEIGVGIGIATVYLLVLLRMASPEERTHMIEYGIVATLIYEALTERASFGRFVPLPALLAILATALIGAIDECIQLFIPDRVFDYRDMVFNALAGIMAVTAIALLNWKR